MKDNLKNRLLTFIAPFILNVDNNISYEKTINCSIKDVDIIIDSTFNVFKLNINNKTFYFRECRRHLTKFEYFLELLNDYTFFFDDIDDNQKKLLTDIYSNRGNLNKLFRIGVVNNKLSNVYKFFINNDPHFLGIPSEYCAELKNLLPNFIRFIWGELYQYNLSRSTKYANFQLFNSSKQIATKIVADELRLNDLIPSTRYIKVIIDGRLSKVGTLMDCAPGVSPEFIDSLDLNDLNPIIQKKLFDLNVLDVLCYQKDHRPCHNGNYNIYKDISGKYSGVCAYDNDSPSTFFPTTKLSFSTSARTSSFVKNNLINRKYIDMEIYESIIDLNVNNLLNKLKCHLNLFQLLCFKLRFIKLKKILNKSKKNPDFCFLNKDEWTFETLNNEMNDGNNLYVSYMYSLIKKIY